MNKQVSKYEFLENLDERFLGCRDLRHAWYKPQWYQEPDGTVIRVTKCLRCETRREDVIDKLTGDVSRSYSYPNGYLLAPGHLDDRPSAADVRLESIARATPKKVKDRSEIHHA